MPPLEISHLSELADRLTRKKKVVVHCGVSEPRILTDQLISQAHLWPDLTVRTLLANAPSPLADGPLEVETLLPGGALAKAVNSGAASVLRDSLFEHASFLADETRTVDVLLLQVSPPDDHGRVSLGPTYSFMPQWLAQKPLLIAQVNAHVPRTSATLAWDQLDAVLHHDTPLPQWGVVDISAADRTIATHLHGILQEGDTVEIGIGSVPDAIAAILCEGPRVRLHTGLMGDRIMEVVKAGGAIGPVTATMAAGTAEFYKWLDANPAVDLQPVIETHDPARLAAIDRFMAINSALQVDLMGRVNAERVGGRIVSCPGGLPDFASVAKQSKKGKSIVVLRSTARNGSLSTIVRDVEHVTLGKEMVDIIVTEYGVADIANKSGEERAVAIRAIAHPQFRDDL